MAETRGPIEPGSMVALGMAVWELVDQVAGGESAELYLTHSDAAALMAYAAHMWPSRPGATEDDEDLEEEIGLLVDKCENLLAAARLPVSPAIHVEGLCGGVKDLRDGLAAIAARLRGEGEDA